MDTVQNIRNVIVDNDVSLNDGSVGQVPGTQDPKGLYGGSNQGHHSQLARRSTAGERREFLSRPNWLFTHNENVLFCSALQYLRFDDQNNVPRKFIEEWFQNNMVSMDTQWPAGQRYLRQSMDDMTKNEDKFLDRQMKEANTRRKEFYKNRKAALAHARRAFSEAKTVEEQEATEALLHKAQIEASVPESEIEVQFPHLDEVALVELGIKIMRRLQGQTDRLDMAEELANQPFINDDNHYFHNLREAVRDAIHEKHEEIIMEREKVELKSKQSRKRRRQQLSIGTTLSGSATRVRFTNREMAMLIHWIYSYSKTEWTQRIYEFYLTPVVTRSTEHVRDKMRDLITRSKETDKGGLLSMKTRSLGNLYTRKSEPLEIQELARHDLVDFKYPAGPLEQVPGGRYFDEDRNGWVDGVLPHDHFVRYQEEVQRIRDVVKSKADRSTVRPSVPDQVDNSAAFLNDNFPAEILQAQHHHGGNGHHHTNHFVPQNQGHHQQPTFDTDVDFNIVKDLQDGDRAFSLWGDTKRVDPNSDAASMAAAALKADISAANADDLFLSEALDHNIKRVRH